jgi:hypothetical protein
VRDAGRDRPGALRLCAPYPGVDRGRLVRPGSGRLFGAANLVGYLAGALLARRMAQRARAAFVLRTNMLLASAAFFACAMPLPFW